MAKIKHTKTELKAQSDALKRFERFLPMLQLKKQQLQAEIATISAHLDTVLEHEAQTKQTLEKWIALYADPSVDIEALVDVKEVRSELGNIAGVAIPLYKGIDADMPSQNPYTTPAWVDDAQEMIKSLIEFKAEGEILRKQRDLVTKELYTTSQRVNLFEKVKIPDCKENIRVIRIFLGDEQTAAVARGKIAKGRSTKRPKQEEAV